MKTTTVGLDVAKNVFQVHSVDGAGEVIVRKALRRRQVVPFFERLEPSLIGMEACGTSHYWARELCGLGHYKMRGTVTVVAPAAFESWLAKQPTFGG